jgi:16S rRNA (guanine966-N2)-methyltransferase
MRVVAGSAKGVRLGPVPGGVRPLSDRAREGLFSSLGTLTVGARVLDLFAGTGAVGIEALSRGAAHATFVERSAPAARAVRDNARRAGVAERATVVRADVWGALASARIQGPFHLVFCDPPYDHGNRELEGILQAMVTHLAPGWRVLLTRGIKSSRPVIPIHWAVARELRYGDSLLTLYRPESYRPESEREV